jgi:hypothetical protein
LTASSRQVKISIDNILTGGRACWEELWTTCGKEFSLILGIKQYVFAMKPSAWRVFAFFRVVSQKREYDIWKNSM